MVIYLLRLCGKPDSMCTCVCVCGGGGGGTVHMIHGTQPPSNMMHVCIP